MLIIGLLFIVLAAVLGFYLLSFVIQNKNTPKGIAFLHGPFAAIGIIILIICAILYHPSLWVSIGIFIIAALGGLTLIFRDLTGHSFPKWLAIGHGLVAIIGFVILITQIYFKS